MPWICTPDFSSSCGPGYSSGPWASAEIFGEPVPLKVRRYLLDPGAMARFPLNGREAFGYVIAGSGTAQAAPDPGGERFSLDAESVLWAAACDGLAA